MMQRHDLHIFASNPVDQAVAPEDDLTYVMHSEFGDRPPGPRESRELIRGPEDWVGEDYGHPRSVARQKETDRLEVVEGLGGPSHSSHLDIRFRASSCEIN